MPGKEFPHENGYQPVQEASHLVKRRRKKRGRFQRFVRGYLMFVGLLTTLYVLAQLIVLLFVQIAKWTV